MKFKTFFFLILGSIIVFSGAYHAYKWRDNAQNIKETRAALQNRLSAWNDLKQKLTLEIGRFNGNAGLLVKDLETGWTISYNKDELFPSASIVKIPIMGACFLASTEGKIKLDRVISLKSSDKIFGSGILKNMSQGTTFTVEKLIGLMIYDSDNTATNMLTDMIGIDYLRNSFTRFGLKNTNLSRNVADYSLRNRGVENYTTAGDMAYILEKIYEKKLINREVSEKCLSILKLQRVNDRIPKYLPPDVTAAHKTGLERSVCHDVGIVFTKKGDFIICGLTEHKNSSSAASKEFIAKITMHVYSYFERL